MKNPNFTRLKIGKGVYPNPQTSSQDELEILFSICRHSRATNDSMKSARSKHSANLFSNGTLFLILLKILNGETKENTLNDILSKISGNDDQNITKSKYISNNVFCHRNFDDGSGISFVQHSRRIFSDCCINSGESIGLGFRNTMHKSRHGSATTKACKSGLKHIIKKITGLQVDFKFPLFNEMMKKSKLTLQQINDDISILPSLDKIIKDIIKGIWNGPSYKRYFMKNISKAQKLIEDSSSELSIFHKAKKVYNLLIDCLRLPLKDVNHPIEILLPIKENYINTTNIRKAESNRLLLSIYSYFWYICSPEQMESLLKEFEKVSLRVLELYMLQDGTFQSKSIIKSELRVEPDDVATKVTVRISKVISNFMLSNPTFDKTFVTNHFKMKDLNGCSVKDIVSSRQYVRQMLLDVSKDSLLIQLFNLNKHGVDALGILHKDCEWYGNYDLVRVNLTNKVITQYLCGYYELGTMFIGNDKEYFDIFMGMESILLQRITLNITNNMVKSLKKVDFSIRLGSFIKNSEFPPSLYSYGLNFRDFVQQTEGY